MIPAAESTDSIMAALQKACESLPDILTKNTEKQQ